MFLLYSFKFHIKLSQSHLVNNRGSSGARADSSCYRKGSFWLEATVQSPAFPQLQGPVGFWSAAWGNHYCPAELIKGKRSTTKTTFAFPTWRFPAVKGVWEGRGSLSLGSPAHTCAPTPGFSAGFAGHPACSWRSLAPFHCQCCTPALRSLRQLLTQRVHGSLPPTRNVGLAGGDTVSQLVQPPDRHQGRGVAGGSWPSHAPSVWSRHLVGVPSRSQKEKKTSALITRTSSSWANYCTFLVRV